MALLQTELPGRPKVSREVFAPAFVATEAQATRTASSELARTGGHATVAQDTEPFDFDFADVSGLESCSVVPFRRKRIGSTWGSGTSSAVTRAGPVGANVSKVLPSSHCWPLRWNCQSRAETSWPLV